MASLSRRLRRVPLQPAFAGWTDEDLKIETERLRLRVRGQRKAKHEALKAKRRAQKAGK